MANAPRDVTIVSGTLRLEALLTVPHGAAGLVVFAHGSGSSRHSSRNRFVAQALEQAGLATLLLDLLAAAEEEEDRVTARLRFDIELLASRVELAIAWSRQRPDTAAQPIGLFGASTGAAAALVAAAQRAEDVSAVVSRGGRPDLAGPALAQVRAPTLLIVGGDDTQVIALNRQAAAHLRAEHEIAIVPHAGHLFEEPGALARTAALARDWFARHVTRAGGSSRPYRP